MFRFKFKKQKQTKARKEYVARHEGGFSKGSAILFSIIFVIFITFFACYIDFECKYFISNIHDISMQPTFNEKITSKNGSQDFVYVNRRATPTNGDIVVIDRGENEDDIIKRVIAKPGDKVSIIVGEDNLYHISMIYAGEEEAIILEENYIRSAYDWKNCTEYGTTITVGDYTYEWHFYNTIINNSENEIECINGIYYCVIPNDGYFCLGDNRMYSSDSRKYGLYQKSSIMGVAEIIVKDGNLDDGEWIVSKKISAIFNFYWGRIAKSFAR